VKEGEEGAAPEEVQVAVEDDDHVECTVPEYDEVFRIVRLPVES
jgi:hypothetical protein